MLTDMVPKKIVLWVRKWTSD